MDKASFVIAAKKIDNLIFVFQSSNGKKYLLCDKVRPVVFAGAPDGFGTGKETAALKEISMEFSYNTANLYVYTRTVPLTEAVI